MKQNGVLPLQIKKVLQPVVEEVFERNDNLEFKKYKQPQSAVLN